MSRFPAAPTAAQLSPRHRVPWPVSCDPFDSSVPSPRPANSPPKPPLTAVRVHLQVAVRDRRVIGFGFGNRTVASSAWPPCGAASRCGLPGGARDVGGDDVGGRSGRGELAGRLHHYAEGRVAATWAARSGHCWADGDRRVHWSHGPVGGGKSADRMTGSRQCRCAARRVAGLRGTRKEAGRAAVPWLAQHGTGSVPHRGGEADRRCLPQAATRGPGSLSRCAT